MATSSPPSQPQAMIEDPPQHAVGSHGVAAHPHPGDDARDQRQRRDQPVRDRAVADGDRAADVEEHRHVGRSRPDVGRLQRCGDGNHVLAGCPHRFTREPLGCIARRVVRVAVADRREVQAGNVACLEDREIGVVRQARVDLDRIRAATRMRRPPRPRRHQPGVAGPCLEQDRRARRSNRFEVDIGPQPAGHLAIGDERRRAHESGLLGIGDERQQRPARPARRGEHTGRLQRHRNPQRIVGRARRVR